MSFLNNLIVSFVKLLPESVVHIFAKKYIAGETLQDAINVTKELNSKGIVVTMDVLGESINSNEEAKEEKEECLRVLKAIDDNNLDANLSIKPTSLGLSIDPEYFYQNMREVIQKAKEYNNFVRVDMENSPYTDLTIKYFKKLQEEFDNVGIVLQAYLKRTEKDILELNKTNTHYRLCKGIYIEPAAIAYKDKQKVRDNFLMLLEKMLKNGSYVGIATHDDYLIKGSYDLIKKMNLSKDKYEFQMLYGVQEKLRDQVNNDGHKIRVYVPYGKKWYAYSVRRMQENPEIAMHITKSVLKIS
ncbi:MAG: proline dehydrogenase family protein [Melioribacteraceae bacterium]|nr:proline dehydrogenase family protein [Melioribacteraceae bacterium]